MRRIYRLRLWQIFLIALAGPILFAAAVIYVDYTYGIEDCTELRR